MTEGKAAGTSQPQLPSPMAFPLRLLLLPRTLLPTTLFSHCLLPCHHQLGLDPQEMREMTGVPWSLTHLSRARFTESSSLRCKLHELIVLGSMQFKASQLEQLSPHLSTHPIQSAVHPPRETPGPSQPLSPPHRTPRCRQALSDSPWDGFEG